MTEWKQFRLVDWVDVFSSTKGKIIIDGRNIYDEKELKDLGANYYRIGKETR